jgi:flagellar M-ring protein FliF
MLTIRPDARLTDKQINGVYSLTQTAVPDLSKEDITVTDGDGNMLIPLTQEEKDAANSLEKLDYEKRRTTMQLEFRQQVQRIYNEQLNNLLKGAFKNYNVSVFVDLDYGKKVTQDTQYTPSVAESGTKGGMVNKEIWKQAAGGMLGEGGLAGTANNANISSDFPSVPDVQPGNDAFLDQTHEVNYLVNELKSQYESDGFDIKNITAAVVVDSENMPEADVTKWQSACADAIGASTNNTGTVHVTFQTLRWPSELPADEDANIVINDANRNILVFIIITLGTLLIILFLIAILTSGSKKKRHVRARMATLAASNAAGTSVIPADDVFAQARAAVNEQQEEFDLPSLLDSDGTDQREAVLKREIRDFAKSNPEIVAQLIRTWMKSEDE